MLYFHLYLLKYSIHLFLFLSHTAIKWWEDESNIRQNLLVLRCRCCLWCHFLWKLGSCPECSKTYQQRETESSLSPYRSVIMILPEITINSRAAIGLLHYSHFVLSWCYTRKVSGDLADIWGLNRNSHLLEPFGRCGESLFQTILSTETIAPNGRVIFTIRSANNHFLLDSWHLMTCDCLKIATWTF